MATPAVPSQAFGDVQRYLRQKRATGQNVSPREEKLAWEAYWDSMSSQQHISRQLGIAEETLDLRKDELANTNDYRNSLLDLRKDELSNADDAAKVAGAVEIAGTAATTGMLLKGTKLGSKIGLGPSATTATAPSAAAAPPATGTAAPLASVLPTGGPGTFGPSTVGSGSNIPMAGRTGALAVGLPAVTAPSVGGSFAIPTAASLGPGGGIPTLSGSAVSASAPAAWSAATGTAPAVTGAALGTAAGAAGLAGAGGSFIGGKVAGDKGSVTGGLAGGAAAGGLVGGPVGAVIGGVIGGFSSLVTGGKESSGNRSQEMLAKAKGSQQRMAEARLNR